MTPKRGQSPLRAHEPATTRIGQIEPVCLSDAFALDDVHVLTHLGHGLAGYLQSASENLLHLVINA
jgi:hypothetical protein